MADDEYNRKMESLQQYIPFLNNMIAQLKDPRKKNREQQLAKMVSLHSMITDKKKKLKLGTLIKCEDVILKLYGKVKSTPHNTSKPVTKAAVPATPKSPPITPSSPSPPRDLLKTKPVVIPTEKVNDRVGNSSNGKFGQSTITSPSSLKPKIDIYSSAGDSLKKTTKPTLLETHLPDMSKPPISIADLEALQDDSCEEVDTERMSLNELTHLREKLQSELESDQEIEKSPVKLNKQTLTKKSPDNNASGSKTIISTNKSPDKSVIEVKTNKTPPTTVKPPVKVVRESDSIFGSALSSIDQRIISYDRRNSKDGDLKPKPTPSNAMPKKDDKPPVFERLADKYNRKPRKPSIDAPAVTNTEPKSSSPIKSSVNIESEGLSKMPPAISAGKIPPNPLINNVAHPFRGITRPPVAISSVKPPTPQIPPLLPTPAIRPSLYQQQQPPRHQNYHHNVNNDLPPSPRHVLNQFYNNTPQVAPQPPYHQRSFTPTHNSQPRNEYYNKRSSTPGPYVYDRRQPRDNPPERPRERDWRGGETSSRDPRVHSNARREDPRTHRPRDDRDRERTKYRERDPRQSRYDPSRSRDRDRSRDSSRTFTSPLDSLYTGGDRKTGVGYGVQKFKIPKIKKDDAAENAEKKEDGVDVKSNVDKKENVETNETDNVDVKKCNLDTKKEVEKTEVEKVPEIKEETKTQIETNEVPNVSSSTESATKDKAVVEVKDEKTPEVKPEEQQEVSEITSTNDINEPETSASTATSTADDSKQLINPSQTEIINQFFKKLLENENTRPVASLLIESVTNSLDDEKLKTIVEKVKSNSEEKKKKRKRIIIEDDEDDDEEVEAAVEKSDEEKNEKDESEEEEEAEEEEPKPVKKKTRSEIIAAKKRQETKKKLTKMKKAKEKQMKKAKVAAKVVKTVKKSPSPKIKEPVVVSVGERIKNRKRQVVEKKKARHKTELDLLHEDIQDMFIRDGVLTATGKRMCRILKSSGDNKTSETKPQTPPRKRTRRSAESSVLQPKETDKVSLVKDIRVVLPKLSANQIQEFEDENKRYSLRRSKLDKSYAEDEDSDVDMKVKKKVAEKPKEPAPSETVEEPDEPLLIPKAVVREKPMMGKRTRKRNSAWASGVIMKKKRGIVSKDKKPEGNTADEEEEEESPAEKTVEFVEPDRHYYSDKTWTSKYQCKLCSYYGTNIARHYIFGHPESEVLISRLSPGRADEAILESYRLKLEEKPDETLYSVRSYTFKCRFCDLCITSRPSNFYDHITTHTGEYRHTCHLCNYAGSNSPAVTMHVKKVHRTEREYHAFSIKTRIYGYLCLDCNFVQLDRKSVENHVNIYHLGEGKKIAKINLSSIEPVGCDRKKEIKEQTDEKPETEEPPKLEPAVPSKPAEVAQAKVVASPSIKRENREIDMTVFTCNTDLQEENDEIEQERLRKMTELNDTVKTNRQSLSIVERLSNRLSQPETDTVNVKNEPPDLEPEPEPLIEVVPKLTKQIETVLPTTSIEKPSAPSAKGNMIIDGMIKKLQGKLKEEQEGPPPLVPILSVIPSPPSPPANQLTAGFMNVRLEDDGGYTYMCRVPSCLFESKDRNLFVTHWKEGHKRINDSYKNSKCKICLKDIITKHGDENLLLVFFKHIEDNHLAALRKCNAKSEDEETDKYKFEKKFIERDHKSSDEDDIVEIEDLAAHGEELFPTRTNDVDPLAFTEDDTPSEYPVECPKAASILRTRRLSGDLLSNNSNDNIDVDIISDDTDNDNPFPFKISGVMSLACEEPKPVLPTPKKTIIKVPPLSPLKEIVPKPQTKFESVVLKEARLTSSEKSQRWKCPEALKKFLGSPRELYKCPQFSCKFVSWWRHLFEVHVKRHVGEGDELVCCVYCDIKTPLAHSGIHIDLRHSNCLYSCSQCLYRALKREYVLVHLKREHRNSSDMIISLPPKAAKTIMMSKQKKFTVREACSPYKCGECDAEFLFKKDFEVHLEVQHPFQDGLIVYKKCGYKSKHQFQCAYKYFEVDKLVNHWRTHNCYDFHCLLCKFGCDEVYSMLEHYVSLHRDMEPLVVDRREGLKPYNPGYGEDALGAIKLVKQQILDSVSNQKYNIVDFQSLDNKMKPSTSPAPAVTPPKQITIPACLIPIGMLTSPVASTPKKQLVLPNKSIVPLIIASSSPAITSVNTTTFSTAPTKSVVSTTNTNNAPAAEPILLIDDEAPKDVAEAQESVLDLDSECSDEIIDVIGDGDCHEDEITPSPESKSFCLIGYQLFRCLFCDISFSNSKKFRFHCNQSKQCQDQMNTARPFKCVHCERNFKTANYLIEHIQYHGPMRFACSLCIKKFPSQFSCKLHMRSKHNVTQTLTTPLVLTKRDLERDEFVVRPKLSDFENPNDAMDKSGGSGGEMEKSEYGPEDIECIPKRYIFTSMIKCSLCPYSTKVRTNLVRHLQFHSTEVPVPETAPVNPVPCLDKNEKMFDKMTNLAMSSMTTSNSSGGRMGGAGNTTSKSGAKSETADDVEYPAYIPSTRRYVCVAPSCTYLCLEEANLRHHLLALHSSDGPWQCPHCKANLRTDNIDGVMKHFHLHEAQLYKCAHCLYVHNSRRKVDKHCQNIHEGSNIKSMTLRNIIETDLSAPSTSTSAPPIEPELPKAPKSWHCGMCKYKCVKKNEIQNHIVNKHNCDTQYKCTLCTYKSDEKDTFKTHFERDHSEQQIDIIRVYYKNELTEFPSAEKFDTTPLWQRDRPRIRHIRGILFEETASIGKKKNFPSTRLLLNASDNEIATPNKKTINNDAVKVDDVPVTSKPLNKTYAAIKANKSVSKITVDDSEAVKSTNIEAVAMTTAEEKDSELPTVIIDDDDDDFSLKLLDSSASEENLMIDMKKEDFCEDVKPKVIDKLLSEQLLIDKYGVILKPVKKLFKCPKCGVFKTSRPDVLVHHILNEMKCYRFKCKTCEYKSVTLESMSKHNELEHKLPISDGFANTTDKCEIERTLEYWLQLLLATQSKSILSKKGVTLPLSEEMKTNSPAQVRCDFCQKWYGNMAKLRSHMIEHWANHSYKCGHCLSEQTTLDDLFQHTFTTHPGFTCWMRIINGPHISKLISTLKEPQESPQASKKAAALIEDEDPLDIDNKDAENTTKSTNNKKETVKGTLACAYCHERDTEENLLKHHKAKHDNSVCNFYQYVCLECPAVFKLRPQVMKHFASAHRDKKLSYCMVDSKPSKGEKQLVCTKCSFQCQTVGNLRGHVKKHLRPVDCLICGKVFTFPMIAREHHSIHHAGKEERIKENAERLEQYENMVQEILRNRTTSKRGARPKMYARKSTGARAVAKCQEFSFYGPESGQKTPTEEDLNVRTSILDIGGVESIMTVKQLNNMYDCFPVVMVTDCGGGGSCNY